VKQKKSSYYTVPDQASSLLLMVWLPLSGGSRLCRGRYAGTQDKFYDFFQIVQDKLRSKAKPSSPRLFDGDEGGGSGNLFPQFLVAYGGVGIVTPDGN